MLLHLGGDWAANSRRIIAILDYGSVGGSRCVKRLLQQARTQNLLERVDDGPVRSLILLDSPSGTRLVLSPISSSALKGRLAANAAAEAAAARNTRKGRNNG